MIRVLSILFALFAGIHGLIHLMGFVAYWPLAKIDELPYKTSLLSGKLELGAAGMRIYSLFWLLATLGFVVAAIALGIKKPVWAPLMLAATVLSLVLCVLDWRAAFRGAWIDVFFLLVLFVVFGLRVQPAPFPEFTGTPGPVTTRPIPAGLPAPVERFYRAYYGDEVPVISSAVINFHGTVRLMGITMPARLRFSHIAGKDYRHYIETTFYGFPIMKVNERYLDGHSRLELPFQLVENDPKVEGPANQGLWAEILGFLPAAMLTDERVRWEALDDTTAKAYVPFGESEQVFTVEFDPQTGLLDRAETLRYYDEKKGAIRWWVGMTKGDPSDDQTIPVRGTATWEHEGTPWMVIDVEDTIFNADLTSYIRQFGP